MNLQRCSRGHFYDADKFSACPHCDGSIISAQKNETMPVTVAMRDPGATIAAPADAYSGQSIDLPGNELTTTFKIGSVEPVVGWLVCIKGKHMGEAFSLKTGRNFIGRSSEMDVCLKGEQTVSKEKHAAVIYEPKGNVFMAQPGESSQLFYVGGNVVLSPTVMVKNDRLDIGDVELMLIPCCDEAFSWPKPEEATEEKKK